MYLRAFGPHAVVVPPPAPQGAQVPSVAQQVPSLAEQVTSLAQQVPSLAQQLPSLAEQVPTLAQQVPSLAQQVPTLAQCLLNTHLGRLPDDKLPTSVILTRQDTGEMDRPH
ncbi:hypothetical protein FN846DRAFT_910529 [Sphaerosporella brunnea]|uniref:Uncharacterized protein n=1 Tax=Sphaerosporella brunnea TaxID=1250544 RepID=A0A5J5EP89_9PEZI|nr:hypothetical protein FN846DRAFT_910529 [Sphaerosporella brunnea]